MSDALITGLAVLLGAAVGGLVTVWATHKTNVAAAERERKQRLHDHAAKLHAEASNLFSSFYGALIDVQTQPKGYAPGNDDDLVELGKLYSKICVLHPRLKDAAANIMKRENFRKDEHDAEYLRLSRDILSDLDPKNIG